MPFARVDGEGPSTPALRQAWLLVLPASFRVKGSWRHGFEAPSSPVSDCMTQGAGWLAGDGNQPGKGLHPI